MSTNSCAFDTISVDGFKVGRDRLNEIFEFRYGFEKERNSALFSGCFRGGKKKKGKEKNANVLLSPPPMFVTRSRDFTFFPHDRMNYDR